MIWTGGMAVLVGIAATLWLSLRWARRAQPGGFLQQAGALAAIAMPLWLGVCAMIAAVRAGDPSFASGQELVVAFALAFVVAYAAAFLYVVFFRWTLARGPRLPG